MRGRGRSLNERVRAMGVLALLVAAVSGGRFALADENSEPVRLRVMSFNILQGGGNATNVGFGNARFGGSRFDELAQVILDTKTDVVGIQEDTSGDGLLRALGDGWQRAGSIYARYPIRALPSPAGVAVARVELGARSVVVINCHWRPYPYGPYEVQERVRADTVPEDRAKFADEVVRASDKVGGVKGRRETLEVVRYWRRQGETVLVTGDFNEPSHLDWTDRAAREGLDRWVENPTSVPLRFAIPWPGSIELRAFGLRDVYRERYPDEVSHSGNTWTPRYAKGESDRREWGEQVLDRIDLVYVAGPGVRVVDAARVTERGGGGERRVGDVWPSDHYAVWGELELEPTTPKLRVFLLAGQSNMEGQGVVDLDHPEHYNGGRGTLVRVIDASDPESPVRELRASDGAWREREDVAVWYRCRDGAQEKIGPLSVGFGAYPGRHHFGPELGFGQRVGDAIEAPVLLIKACWGGKSLHRDFRPPSAEGDTGPCYRRMLEEVDTALGRIPRDFPQWASHQTVISGVVWFQGWNDAVDEGAAAGYEENLACWLRDVRRDFGQSDLPVVIGETGNTDRMTVRQAQQRVVTRAEFAHWTRFVPTAEFRRPAEESPNTGHGHHWFGNAGSVYEIGRSFGEAMLAIPRIIPPATGEGRR